MAIPARPSPLAKSPCSASVLRVPSRLNGPERSPPVTCGRTPRTHRGDAPVGDRRPCRPRRAGNTGPGEPHAPERARSGRCSPIDLPEGVRGRVIVRGFRGDALHHARGTVAGLDRGGDRSSSARARRLPHPPIRIRGSERGLDPAGGERRGGCRVRSHRTRSRVGCRRARACAPKGQTAATS